MATSPSSTKRFRWWIVLTCLRLMISVPLAGWPKVRCTSKRRCSKKRLTCLLYPYSAFSFHSTFDCVSVEINSSRSHSLSSTCRSIQVDPSGRLALFLLSYKKFQPLSMTVGLSRMLWRWSNGTTSSLFSSGWSIMIFSSRRCAATTCARTKAWKSLILSSKSL